MSSDSISEGGAAKPSVTPADIRAAHRRIASRIRRTPLLETPVAGAPPVSLKLECLQHSGSFKARGAFNNLLTRPAPPAGCATASGGNHGAAVAYAAQQLGVRAHVFVPEIATPAKISRILAYGAEAAIGGGSYAEAQMLCDAYVVEVEVWRGDVGLSMSVSAPFVWRCLSGSAVAPFPHPAHR